MLGVGLTDVMAFLLRSLRPSTCWFAGMWMVPPLQLFRSMCQGSQTTSGQWAGHKQLIIKSEPPVILIIFQDQMFSKNSWGAGFTDNWQINSKFFVFQVRIRRHENAGNADKRRKWMELKTRPIFCLVSGFDLTSSDCLTTLSLLCTGHQWISALGYLLCCAGFPWGNVEMNVLI